MKGLIQVSCKKVEKGETLYQAMCKEIREEMRLHLVSKYLTKNNRFNYNIYITDIMRQELSQWMESEKNGLWVLYKWTE